MPIFKPLKYIQTTPERQFLICTDSLSVVEAMKGFHKNRNRPPIILNSFNLIFKLENDNKNISFTWIPEHAGISGNEQADQLANLARVNGEFLNIALPLSDIYNVIKSKSLIKWQHQ